LIPESPIHGQRRVVLEALDDEEEHVTLNHGFL
jgi:hypothetical protein